MIKKILTDALEAQIKGMFDGKFKGELSVNLKFEVDGKSDLDVALSDNARDVTREKNKKGEA